MAPFLYATAMLSSKDNMVGVAVKGVYPAYQQTAFSEYLVAGTLPDFGSATASKACIISEKIANTLDKKVGDTLIARFLESPPRMRKLYIAGLYNTQLMQEFDEKVIFVDRRVVQQIKGLAQDEVEGVEVFLKDHTMAHSFYEKMFNTLSNRLYPELVQSKYPYIFDWLHLIQNNAFIFVALIVLVSCFNMVSSFLILTMDRYRMIGLLKVLGGRRQLMDKMFFYYASLLVVKGMLWGNALAFALAGVQYFFRPIQLDPASYSVAYLPIAWDIEAVLLGNVLVFFFLQLTVSLPIRIASRQRPIHTLRFI